MARRWIDGRVVERVDWHPGLHSLRVSADFAPFEAGQFAKLGLDIDGEVVGRPYSLVNPPGDALLDFYFAEVPEGPLSPRLARLGPGDPVLVSPNATGFLVLSEIPRAANLWLIATGTGLGPFLSILRTPEPWERFGRVVLVHAVRTAPELAYGQTIERLSLLRRERFAFVPFVSRQKTDFALAGRIPQAIADGRLEARAGARLSSTDSHVMLCGNPRMIDDVTAALAERGFRKHRRRDPGQVSVETYW